jgi:hypothetical protein
MNKLGQYDDGRDGRSNYSFNFSDNEGKHISVSFRAEPDYDLDIIFNEFRNFLIASGHDVEGQIGELFHEEDDYDNPIEQSWEDDSDAYREAAVQNFLNPTQDKFSMENFPNNGWPFGDLTTASIPALTTADIAPLTVTNLETNQTYSYKDRYGTFPTMSPITTQQIQAWSLSSADIQSLTVADLSTWKMDAPGTIGGAKVNFK